MYNKRILWIDALKGFGIFLVTFAHLNIWDPLEAHIYSFHMCLFFFISGFLFKCNLSIREYAYKKIRNLLIPFFMWDILSTLLVILLGGGC